MSVIILLAIFGWLAYRVVSPEERERALARSLALIRRLKVEATAPRPDYDSFCDALRVRTSHVFVTPAFAIVSATIVCGMLFGATSSSDPETLVAWGASVGTRTTNAEWWRLVTSTFVHTSTLHLLVDVAVLLQLGAILERLVGRLTIAAVYLSAGAFACLVNLSSHPVAVTTGSSAAVFGLYGLLLASLIWQTFQGWRSRRDPDAEQSGAPDADETTPPDVEESAARPVTIPLIALKRLGVGAGVFVLYSALSGFAHAAELTGLLVGLIYGLVLARRAIEKGPQTLHVGYAMATTCVVAVACAISLRNIADVRPEIQKVLATEERTAAAYRAGSDAFKRGRTTAEALAQLAERTIIPELQAADARLKALHNVPPEHQPLVADAREYLRLRCASWRARAAVARKTLTASHGAPDGAADVRWRLQAEARFRSDMAAVGTAESAERASLEAFQRIKVATPLER